MRELVARGSLGVLIGASLLGIIAGSVMITTGNSAVELAARDGWADTNAASVVAFGTWWLGGGCLVGVVLLFFGAFFHSAGQGRELVSGVDNDHAQCSSCTLSLYR